MMTISNSTIFTGKKILIPDEKRREKMSCGEDGDTGYSSSCNSSASPSAEFTCSIEMLYAAALSPDHPWITARRYKPTFNGWVIKQSTNTTNIIV